MTHVNHTFALNIKMYVIYAPFYYSSSNLPHNLYKKKLLFIFFGKQRHFFKLLVIFDLFYPLLFLMKQFSHSLNVSCASFFETYFQGFQSLKMIIFLSLAYGILEFRRLPLLRFFLLNASKEFSFRFRLEKEGSFSLYIS